MEHFSLKSYQFRKERERSWKELARLVEKVDGSGIRSLSSKELGRLPTLYRSAVSSLSVARAISLDKALVRYLEALVSRAYTSIYGAKNPALATVRTFFTHRFPAAVRRYRRQVATSTAILLLGVLCGYTLTKSDPNRFYTFVPGAMAEGRTPDATAAELREGLYSTADVDELQFFAMFLFRNNAQIGILCFALGFAAGAPVVLLLFYNGAVLGSMAAVFGRHGLGLEFWGWVLPHGVTELGAICLCGAAGLVLGQALVFPGRYTRVQMLGRRGREASLLVIGSVVMLFIAALLEGWFRQLVQDPGLRWGVAATTLLVWALYFTLMGRDHEPRTDG